MARLNQVTLLGALTEEPEFFTKKEKRYVRFNVVTARSPRGISDGHKYIRTDYPLCMAMEDIPENLKEIESWRPNDVVLIKGVLAAQKIKNAIHCQECGSRKIVVIPQVFVYVVHCLKVRSFENRKDALSYVMEKHAEISNQISVMGKLTRDPKRVKIGDSGELFTQYQIEMVKKFRLPDDKKEERRMWPWVKSYGENGVADFHRLKNEAMVFIDGCLQARDIEQTETCDVCQRRFKWKNKILEIVPYVHGTDYLTGCRTDEEVAAWVAERERQSEHDKEVQRQKNLELLKEQGFNV